MVQNDQLSIFVSYSSKDIVQAETLVNFLKNRNIDVWVDYEQINLGDPILTRISEGLSNASYLMLLVSKNSGESPWCRKEYEPLLRKEILTGTTMVIPIILDDAAVPILLQDKSYLNFENIDALDDFLSKSKKYSAVIESNNTYSEYSNILDGLVFLLLIDQFPIGVWGKSLVDLSKDYGHEEDPGSITVSTWASDALRIIEPNEEIPEITSFSNYLHKRRKKKNGAVGMLRQVGTPQFKEELIIENIRHTAMASKFLYEHCNELDNALQSLKYVMESRTRGGAWVAIDESIDDNADPLTTAYVLNILKQFESKKILDSITIEKRDLFTARYWKKGLLWLYENLLENHGWWVYKDARRTYCYTTDVLISVPEFWIEDNDYEKEHESLIVKLFEIWKENGLGIPKGPESTLPNLEATAQFVAITDKCKIRYPQIFDEVKKTFLQNVEAILSNGESEAGGWAVAVTLLNETYGITLSTSLKQLREIAINVNVVPP